MRLHLIERLRSVAAHASGLAGTRLALLSLEVEEELERQFTYLLLVVGAAAFAAMATLFASLAILISGWQAGYPIATAIGLTLFHGAAVAVFIVVLRQRRSTAQRPFAATIAEFELDAQALGKKAAETP